MKKLLIVLMAFIPELVWADGWGVRQNVMYLKGINSQAVLFVSKHREGVLFEKVKQCIDFKEDLKEPSPAPDMFVNGVKLKMEKMCLYDSLIFSPATDKGSHYFLSLIDENKDINVQSEDKRRSMKFVNRTGHEAIQQLMNQSQQPDDAI